MDEGEDNELEDGEIDDCEPECRIDVDVYTPLERPSLPAPVAPLPGRGRKAYHHKKFPKIDGSEPECRIDVDVYTPLERPSLPAPAAPLPVIQEPSDNEDQSSDSSDSDGPGRGRKPYLHKKFSSKPSEVGPAKRKKYNIWCTDATDEILADNLVNCNVDRRTDRSRQVESYDFSLARDPRNQERLFPKTAGVSNKRRSSGDGVGRGRRRHNKCAEAPQLPAVERQERNILPLTRCEEDSAEDLAKDIAKKLLEEKEDVILKVIDGVGKLRAVELFEETVQVEKNGGLLIMNGSRRRTPGGVFFYLAKTSPGVTPEVIEKMFGDSRRATAREIKKAKAAKRKAAIRKEDYTTLLTKAEAAILSRKKTDVTTDDAMAGEDDQECVKNPPPSPATDGRESEPSP